MATAAPLTPIDYIAWVRRSFNRILGQTEATDGTDSPTYRDLIEMFQRGQGFAVTRAIYPMEQDRIIKLNHADAGYMQWIRATLNIFGFTDSPEKKAIGSFQKSVGIGNDGWIGAQTETALIAVSG